MSLNHVSLESSKLRRKALTLLEFIIVFAIIIVLIGILLPAISNVRSAAARTINRNQLKQIVLSFHMAINDNSNRVPGLANPEKAREGFNNNDKDPFYSILPYTEGTGAYPFYWEDPPFGLAFPLIKQFLSPTDITIAVSRSNPLHRFDTRGPISYAAKIFACAGNPIFPGDFTDGSSNTIAFSEGYYETKKRSNTRTYLGVVSKDLKTLPYPFDYIGDTSTFANANHFEVLPVTRGNPPITTASVPGIIFQLTPRIEDGDGRQLQASQPNGLLVAMFDGSVRTIGPKVSESSFWSLVTRNGSEVNIVE